MAAEKRRGKPTRTKVESASEESVITKKPVGRPKGEPSTIVNVRIPLTLVGRLDRYLDRIEVKTGLKANRGMIARRALELFLEAHERSWTG